MMRDSKLWTWHLAAGGVILVFLSLHMAVMHLNAILGVLNPAGGSPVDWANVVARARSVFFAVTYVVLLGAALFHGLYGLRNILLELGPARWLRTAIGVVLLVGGIGLFVVGAWAAFASLALARAV